MIIKKSRQGVTCFHFLSLPSHDPPASFILSVVVQSGSITHPLTHFLVLLLRTGCHKVLLRRGSNNASGNEFIFLEISKSNPSTHKNAIPGGRRKVKHGNLICINSFLHLLLSGFKKNGELSRIRAQGLSIKRFSFFYAEATDYCGVVVGRLKLACCCCCQRRK